MVKIGMVSGLDIKLDPKLSTWDTITKKCASDRNYPFYGLVYNIDLNHIEHCLEGLPSYIRINFIITLEEIQKR